MSYTFGGGTGDDLTWTQPVTLGASSRTSLICGWWMPTTLTATRGLWSAASVYGAEIDTTTDELRLRTDNTTDGQWTTAGVDLAVNEWKFLAFMSTQFNGTPSAAWRVWAGTVETAPVEVTVSVATSPVGNFTGSTLFYLGNKGTGTLAFQGEIGSGFVINSSESGIMSPFGNTSGAITDTEAQFVYERFVLPAWEGELFRQDGAFRFYTYTTASALTYCWDLDKTIPQIYAAQTSNATAFAGILPTITGAVLSENRTPKPLIYNPLHPIPVFGV